MYQPAPSRVKKTSIVRSRGGCTRCRQKRRKCDEVKPSCNRCLAIGSECRYSGLPIQFRESTQWAAQKVDRGKGIGTPSPHGSTEAADNGHKVSTQNESASLMAMDPEGSLARPLGLGAQADDGVNNRSVVSSSPDALGKQWSGVAIDLEALPDEFGSCNDYEGSFADFFGLAWIEPPQSQHHATTPPAIDIVPGMTTTNELTLLHSPPLTTENECRREDSATAQSESAPPGHDFSELDHLHSLSSQPSPATSTSRSPTTPLASPPPRPPSRICHSQRIYLAHFKVTVLQSLPLELPFLWDLLLGSEPVCFAALALAAASLANVQGRYEDDDGKGAWVSMPLHTKKASTFSAKTVTALRSNITQVSLQERLATMLLMVHYELEAGFFGNAMHILSALNTIILQKPDFVLALLEGPSLARWWLHLRSLINGSRGPHVPCGSETPIEPIIVTLEQRVATNAQVIDSIATKAGRIWHRVLCARCFGKYGDSSTSIMKKIGDWWRILKGNLNFNDIEEQPNEYHLMTETELFLELDHLRTTLNSCNAPIEFRPDLLETTQSTSDEPEPVLFSTHRQAMEIVDYAFAHIICDGNLLLALADGSSELPRQFPEDMSTNKNPWVNLMLQTAAGLNLPECARENAYRRGIVASLLYAGMYCPGQVSSRFIRSIVSRLLASGTFFEGPLYPLRTYFDFYEVMERQIASGRRILYACGAHDEWTPKSQLFSVGKDGYYIMAGCEPGGRYFTDLVTVDD